jgi:GPI-anchor transamidase subunit GAA1
MSFIAAAQIDHRRAKYLKEEFMKQGLEADSQNYQFTTNSGVCLVTCSCDYPDIPLDFRGHKRLCCVSFCSRVGHGGDACYRFMVEQIRRRRQHLESSRRSYCPCPCWISEKSYICSRNQLLLTTANTGYSLWAKDIVYVISDGYMEGMHAWLSVYHNSPQSSQ